MKKETKSEIEINVFNDFTDWIIELGPSAIKERIASISQEYPLAVLEGQTKERTYPDAPRNLRFLQEFLFQINCLEIEMEPKKCKNQHQINLKKSCKSTGTLSPR